MKNKVRLIDITVVSAYMGRFLTAIVSAMVIAVTVSALVSKGGIRDHQTLSVGVPPMRGVDATEEYFEPLRLLLALESGRKVEVNSHTPGWCDRCELHLLPIAEFVAAAAERDLVPLYSICRTRSGADAAVVVARSDDFRSVVPTPQNVMFVDPQSVNGCWVQLEQLESRGFTSPDRVASLRFAPMPSAARVVFSVLMGASAYGACRQSDLTELVAAGDLDRNELQVVFSSPAVPELVVACRPADAEYYRHLLSRTAARIAVLESSGMVREAALLLRSRGMRSMRPVSQDELDRTVALFDLMQERI